MNIDSVQHVLDTLQAPYALVGGRAMAARGYPRFTIDIDLLTSDARVLDPQHWTAVEGGGATVDVRRGDADDPLAGVVHMLLADGTDVDLVVGKWRWEAAVIARADLMAINGTSIRVPTIADLILLKLAAGGYGDLQDAAALLALGDRDAVIRDVELHIGDVRPDVRGAWSELRGSIER
jgi:hypothetical protein